MITLLPDRIVGAIVACQYGQEARDRVLQALGARERAAVDVGIARIACFVARIVWCRAAAAACRTRAARS
jgi:hypothetical protein